VKFSRTSPGHYVSNEGGVRTTIDKIDMLGQTMWHSFTVYNSRDAYDNNFTTVLFSDYRFTYAEAKQNVAVALAGVDFAQLDKALA
jgi:hypothetical protein